MKERMLGALVALSRSVAVFLAVLLCGVVVGALVGGLIWGQWFVGGLGGGCLAILFALPSVPSVRWDQNQPFTPPTPPDERRHDTDGR